MFVWTIYNENGEEINHMLAECWEDVFDQLDLDEYEDFANAYLAFHNGKNEKPLLTKENLNNDDFFLSTISSDPTIEGKLFKKSPYEPISMCVVNEGTKRYTGQDIIYKILEDIQYEEQNIYKFSGLDCKYKEFKNEEIWELIALMNEECGSYDYQYYSNYAPFSTFFYGCKDGIPYTVGKGRLVPVTHFINCRKSELKTFKEKLKKFEA